MSLKIEFVERAARGEKIAPLCREFGISRTTAHKWIKRFKELGYEGLDDESRRPSSTPLATAEEMVVAVLEAREAHPRWGPRKLETVLRRRFADKTPSARTIARILKRAHMVRQRRAKRALSVVAKAPAVEATCPNDVWTVDFKGWWRSTDGERCEPLTVRDGFSRFILAVKLCPSTTESVRKVFSRLFTQYGVPNAIKCDNGAPFVSAASRLGISRLSAWWISLGVRLVRSRPGCPQDNGAHERMHADLRAEIQAHPAESPEVEQRRLDRWRQEFNHVRPHDALGGKTPADVYRVADRKRPVVRCHAYPVHVVPREVYSNGLLAFRGEKVFVGTAFAGLTIGLEEVDPMHVRFWLYDLDLGTAEVVPDVDPQCFDLSAHRVANRTTTRKTSAGLSAQELSTSHT